MGSPTTIQPLSLFPYHYSPLVPVQPLAYTPSPVQSFTDYKMLPRRHQSSRADGSWSMNLFLGTMVFVMIMMFTGQMLYERELRRRLAHSRDGTGAPTDAPAGDDAPTTLPNGTDD